MPKIQTKHIYFLRFFHRSLKQDAGAAGRAENPDAKTDAGEEKVRGEFCEARLLFAPERACKINTLYASHCLITVIVCHAVWVSWGLTRGHPCATMGNHRPHPTRQGVEKELFAFVFLLRFCTNQIGRLRQPQLPQKRAKRKLLKKRPKSVVKPQGFDRLIGPTL